MRIGGAALYLATLLLAGGSAACGAPSRDDLAADQGALTAALPAGSKAVTMMPVRLRDAPSTDGTLIRLLPVGTAVTLDDGQPQGAYYAVTVADGSHGFCHGAYLELAPPGDTPAPATGAGVTGNPGETFQAKATGYFPDNSAIEGGFVDRKGARLRTLQGYLSGADEYVSLAMDTNAFPYGQKLRIQEFEAKYRRDVEFRVVDTGGAFRGRGRSRVDVCVADRQASLDATVNGMLTITVID